MFGGLIFVLPLLAVVATLGVVLWQCPVVDARLHLTQPHFRALCTSAARS